MGGVTGIVTPLTVALNEMSVLTPPVGVTDTAGWNLTVIGKAAALQILTV